ncbi:MAG: relaxase/mobilization nuclease domain-containing protein [Xanthobacteraceae bacterium]|nr:relaxase/mobilization nuclease domain-containing protein [Xanthobacteraceae bacterium]
MILKGSQRGGAAQLAHHLMNDRDNDHIELVELRGFVAGDLSGALEEAHAISKATRCQQFLFSLSLNPPKDQDAGFEAIMDAADAAEERLGLTGQPRAVVIHEKQGRRHAHVVWSRIDGNEMKAINLPHFKNRLRDLSKELYLEHGWELPDGHRENGWKNPLNFTLAEWQQAKRLDLDPREIKQMFQQAWAHSDDQKSLKHALQEHGFHLARGDRRGFVAVDIHGEVFSLARWAGVKTKAVRERLGEPDRLSSVDETKDMIRNTLSQNMRGYLRELKSAQETESQPLADARKTLVRKQRLEREQLAARQRLRQREEEVERAKRFRKGVMGVWDLLTGRARELRRENEREVTQSRMRDRSEKELLFRSQIAERRELQTHMDRQREAHRAARLHVYRQIATVLHPMRANGNAPERSRDPVPAP